jgi:quercetin dioxygenase-like cupin family protein
VTFFGQEPHHSHQPVQGFTRGRDEGQAIDLPNWSMLVKVKAGDTLGRLTALESRMAPQLAGPPAHVHGAHDETFVVLEGQMRFRTGDSFYTAVPGEIVFASRQLAHGFNNPFDDAARYIAILTPSGYENYFVKVAEHVARTGAMPDHEQTRELMAEYDTVLAPPLADPAV